MFSTHHNKSVGFESSWKTEQELTFSESQTEAIITKEAECQVSQVAESSAQTDEIEAPSASSDSIDEGSLLAFLQRITPKVLEELEKQQRSAAFEGYSLVDDESNTKATLLHSLRWPALFSQGVVTSLSWSSTGAVVAVAFGADTHETWCQHKAAVAIWNINRCESVSISPERLLEVSSCIPAVAFHPFNPAILALGTRTGEIHVYNLSDSEVVTPIATGFTGGSGVTCLQWRKCDSGEELVAATQGGHVLSWAVNVTKETMTLTAGFLIMPEDLPRNSRLSGSVTEGGEGVGVTSISFNSRDNSSFVVGVEGGSVLLCSTNGQLLSPVTVEGMQCRRCVVSSLSGHSGRILSVMCSPHHRNGLLTLGSDDQLKLHSFIQTHHPVLTHFSPVPLTTACWSPLRALLVAITTTSGLVSFLDVCSLQVADNALGTLRGSTKEDPLLTLPAPEKPAPVSAIAFNSSNVSVIAVGDSLGRVWVWKLPTEVVSPHTSDNAKLSALLQTATEE